MRSVLFAMIMAVPFSAHGTKQEPKDPVATTPVAVAGAAALAGAAAVNDNDVKVDNDVELTGGDTSSDASSTSDSKSKSKSEAASGSASTIVNTVPRQVPPVFLPALMVSDCGAAGSAGASDKGGAGAFGIVWTTKRCYALRTAINFFAIGEYQTGCELLVWVNKKAFDEIGHVPDCTLIAKGLHDESRAVRDAMVVDRVAVSSDSVAASAPVCGQCATKEELSRAFEKSQAK